MAAKQSSLFICLIVKLCLLGQIYGEITCEDVRSPTQMGIIQMNEFEGSVSVKRLLDCENQENYPITVRILFITYFSNDRRTAHKFLEMEKYYISTNETYGILEYLIDSTRPKINFFFYKEYMATENTFTVQMNKSFIFLGYDITGNCFQFCYTFNNYSFQEDYFYDKLFLETPNYDLSLIILLNGIGGILLIFILSFSTYFLFRKYGFFRLLIR